MKPIEPKRGPSVNKATTEFAKVTDSIEQLIKKQDELATEIRQSAHPAVIVFVDLVGSTRAKTDHMNEPEVWLLPARQFYDVLARYISSLGGRVVKFIGDEAMAVFDGDTRLNDAANFISRIQELQDVLSGASQEKVKVKVAIDSGLVYAIEMPGQTETDVLGTPVDRCARIAKVTVQGVSA